jgi:hypothetical protein
MIGMSVRKDDVFDLTLIQTKLFHAVQNLVFRGIVEKRFDKDDSLAAHDGPRAMDLCTEEIQVVGNLRGFCVPRLPRGRPANLPTPQPGWRRNTESKKRP